MKPMPCYLNSYYSQLFSSLDSFEFIDVVVCQLIYVVSINFNNNYVFVYIVNYMIICYYMVAWQNTVAREEEGNTICMLQTVATTKPILPPDIFGNFPFFNFLMSCKIYNCVA